jgi:hypothetical protein
MTKEIIKYLSIDEDYDTHSCTDVIDISIKLDKKNLKLLKELHGNIGLDEFLQELSDKIKEELKEIK